VRTHHSILASMLLLPGSLCASKRFTARACKVGADTIDKADNSVEAVRVEPIAR
jgi:hypothetical protein